MSILLLPFKAIGWIIATLITVVGGVMKFTFALVFLLLLFFALIFFGVIHGCAVLLA